MKSVKKGFGILFLAMSLLTILTSIVLADFEPGAMCPGCADAKCQYIAPPYTGSIIARWEPSCQVNGNEFVNCILIKGSVKQVGKQPDCEVNFDWTFLAGGWTTNEFFRNLNPSDIRGSCLIDLMAFGGFPCIEVGYPELLAVGNMKYGGEGCPPGYDATNCFTAKVVIMQVMVMQ